MRLSISTSLQILDVYKIWRPSPLFRAHRLEKALGTPARIYYKYEGLSPAGDLRRAAHDAALCSGTAVDNNVTAKAAICMERELFGYQTPSPAGS